MPRHAQQQQKLKACEVCGAFLSMYDNDRRWGLSVYFVLKCLSSCTLGCRWQMFVLLVLCILFVSNLTIPLLWVAMFCLTSWNIQLDHNSLECCKQECKFVAVLLKATAVFCWLFLGFCFFSHFLESKAYLDHSSMMFYFCCQSGGSLWWQAPHGICSNSGENLHARGEVINHHLMLWRACIVYTVVGKLQV